MILQTIDQCVNTLRQEYDIVTEIYCNYSSIETAKIELYLALKNVHKDSYSNNQRLIFVLERDFYNKKSKSGSVLQAIQSIAQDIDISNYFICLLTTNPDIDTEYKHIQENISWDPVPINIFSCAGDWESIHTEHKNMSGKIETLKGITDVIDKLPLHHRDLLFTSDVFCMYPWVGLFIGQDSVVKPCCFSRSVIGDASQHNLKEIWNSPKIQEIRTSMLNGIPVNDCEKCYVQEKLKRDSMRNAINREFAQDIGLVDKTDKNGTLSTFNLKHWDIRYNNLCNFTCRSCNPRSSSSWYQVHNSLNPEKKISIPLLQAGNNQDIIFDQALEHIDTIEKIYFAGGEPSMIENFYKMLEILDARGRHDVKLTYNINLSRLSLKNKSLLALWSKFKNVCVGASLDAEGTRGEYLRPGTVWNDIVDNCNRIKDQCPHVNFYISATTGLINALHIPDFHKSWVDKGFIEPSDFNIQLLWEPAYQGIVNAPEKLKQQIKLKYQDHLSWLESKDPLGRAKFGFNSVIDMCEIPGEYNSEKFWHEINKLDQYHNTNLLTTFPELKDVEL